MNTLNKKNNYIQNYMLMGLEIISIVISYYVAHRFRYKGYEPIRQIDVILCLALIVFSMVISLVLEWNKFIYKRGYIEYGSLR